MGKTVVTYPKLMDEVDFYMALDMSLMVDEIKVIIRHTPQTKRQEIAC